MRCDRVPRQANGRKDEGSEGKGRSARRGNEPRTGERENEAGSILIIALGVLTLIAILGTAFAQLMRLERRATENYVEGRRMELLLDSGLDRVIASLYGVKNFRSFTVYQDTPWLYLLGSARAGGVGEKDLAQGRAEVDDPRVGRWELFSQREGHQANYKTKVIDANTQINLNGRQDTLARMLDNLGQAIEGSTRLARDGKRITNPFYTGPNRSGTRVRGEDLVRFRRLLPGGKFSAKTQLKWIIGPENYEILKDFVTVHSWEDPYTYRPIDGQDEVPIFLGSSQGGGGGRSVGGGGIERQQPASGEPRVGLEARHPININAAPEEVLIACLQGVAGRRILPYSRLGSSGGGSVTPIDQGAQIQGNRPPGKEEYSNVTPRSVFVYTPRLEYEDAKKLADEIVSRRKIQPFMTWRSNETGQPGFEDFIDTLPESFFPGPSRCLIIEPDDPNQRLPQQDVMNGDQGQGMGRLWNKGHAEGNAGERQIRRQRGLPMHSRNAWYFDLIKGVLKANFNPNSRLNRHNPNAAAYVPVDKSDLVWARDRVNLFKGHTTEFCFDSMGIYEITTLGSIADASQAALRGATGVASPDGRVRGATSVAGPDGGASTGALLERPFERKVTTVVKVFDVLRHTNQFHFEKPFISGSHNSRNDRRYVVTYPEPVAALTEMYTQGAHSDGRVELAGLLDGKRLLVPHSAREQLYKGQGQVVMAMGFQDRSDESIDRLRRAIRTGGQNLLGDEITDALLEVLNVNYNDKGSSAGIRDLVRRRDIINLGGGINPDSIHQDPGVDVEGKGCDLQPDGLHTSIVRTPHLNTRVLVLPARSRVGFSGGGNANVGATGLGSRGQNLLGNVPYYDGGLAFWVKFDFDGDDPVFCGLVGFTQVIKEVVPSAADYTGSEGTQFFLFKNTSGELRIVRMYYHQAFLDSGGAEGGASTGGEGGVKLYPDASIAGGGGEGGGGAGPDNPIKENLDQQKLISRSDILVPVKHFRAHEWHHIAVDWNDQSSPYLRLYLDFEEVREGPPLHAQALVDGTANSWVRLNERQPRDRLEIGGFVRLQGVADAGLFKWFTNSTTTGGTQAGAVIPTAQDAKRVMANATIDEFITFQGDFQSAKQYYAASGAPAYYTNQVGEYANVFEVPLPPDVDSVVLRSFDWTSYYPVMYTPGRLNSAALPLRTTPIQCELFFQGLGGVAPPPPFSEPWRDQSQIPNRVGGRRVLRRTAGLIGTNAEVVYRFKIDAGVAQGGATSGGHVQTPAIDDVTLTYFLPSPKILVQEEAE